MRSKTTATKKEARPALVPKLRFPEFRGAEAWNGIRLGDAADIKTGPFGSTLHQRDYVLNGTPIVTVEHLSEGGLVHQNLPMVSDEDKQRLKSYILRPGDIVFSRVGSVDRNSLVRDEENGWLFSGRLLRIRTSSKLLAPSFLSFYFQLETTKHKLRSVAVGQTMASLNTEILSDFPVVTARLTEQQIIAECLSSVDELMAAQARKVDALKTHKKGLMQQLFPREGETQPRLRFPEFQNAGEWEPKTLVDACRMQAGKFVAAADIKEINAVGMFPCYGGNGLRGFTETYTHDGVYPLIGRQGALCGNVKLATWRFHATEHAVVAKPKRGVEVVWLYYLLDLLNLNRFATG